MKTAVAIVLVLAWAIWAMSVVHISPNSLYCRTNMDKNSLAKCR